MGKSKSFNFDGGAGSFLGTALLSLVVTLFTLGICYPFAVVLRLRWRTKHTTIDGRRLVFLGSAWGLFGSWLKWWFLTLITIGIYGFWVVPKMNKWIVENTDFAPAGLG